MTECKICWFVEMGMKRLKQVENKHIKILDQQGMKFVRYVVFDESPLLMIITFIITILTTVMQHWNCTTFILLRREESGKGRGDWQQAKILNTSSSNFKLLEKLENPWGVPLGGESLGCPPRGRIPRVYPSGKICRVAPQGRVIDWLFTCNSYPW